MGSFALRLNSLHGGRRLLFSSEIASHSHASTFVYSSSNSNPVKNDPNIVNRQYHTRGENSGSSFSIANHALVFVSFIIGTAAFGIVKALSQEKREEQFEDLGDHMTRIAEKENSTVNKDDAVGINDAVKKAQKMLRQKMQLSGAPGLVAAVSVDGKTVWEQGFGKADVENNVPCTPKTVLRIASISKPLTMTALAMLMEEQKVDIDAPLQKYVPYFPKKKFEGEEVTITTRHLISHQSGIRHYKKRKTKETNNKQEATKVNANENGDIVVPIKAAIESGDKPNKINSEDVASVVKEKEVSIKKQVENNEVIAGTNKKSEKNGNKKKEESEKNGNKKKEESEKIGNGKKEESEKNGNGKKEEYEFDMKEYYIKERFRTVKDAMKLFQDDELYFKPGTGFLYTTHGWTVVSGVIEGAAEKPFAKVMLKLFHDLGLENTYFDDPSQIIYNRGSYYVRNERGKLCNAPYVDNSYKWAGGGFLSTVQDLAKFGNAMLYASQRDAAQSSTDVPLPPGILKSSTLHQLWNPIPGTQMGWDYDGNYGLGWAAVGDKEDRAFCRETRKYASHTGGAIGASSVLLVMPRKVDECITPAPPQGVVVALITNMSGVGLNTEALKIAKLFENVKI